MKLLIVEGNNEQNRIERGDFGIQPYHILFQKMLRILEPKAKVEFAFPADNDNILPSVKALKTYDGILWTGSSLSVMEDIPSVNQQLSFAEDVFQSGIPFYGSCWGMQVATVVAGGGVKQSPIGLEVGISQPIQLTKSGKESPFFANRLDPFKSLCIHYDDVIKIPENANILASNSHSKVQSMTINYKNSQFFGVQYHPEFNPQIMALIISFLSKKFIEKGIFTSALKVKDYCEKLKNEIDLPIEITDYSLHTQEIKNWLRFIKK